MFKAPDQRCRGEGIDVSFTDELTDTQRSAAEALPDHEERLILATGRYIGEGFDDARLDTLFLAFPVAWIGFRWCR